MEFRASGRSTASSEPTTSSISSSKTSKPSTTTKIDHPTPPSVISFCTHHNDLQHHQHRNRSRHRHLRDLQTGHHRLPNDDQSHPRPRHRLRRSDGHRLPPPRCLTTPPRPLPPPCTLTKKEQMGGGDRASHFFPYMRGVRSNTIFWAKGMGLCRTISLPPNSP
jgi:hypothetical protein